LRITISNVFGSSNRGDALLVEALYSAIRTAFGAEVHLSGIAHFPELERMHLPDVDWSPPPARSYAPNKLMRRVVNGVRMVGALSYSSAGAPDVWPLLSPPAAQRASIRALRDADLVISCAGGFLLDVNASILGNLMQMSLAHRFGRPLILAPQTIGPIRNRQLRAITARVLSKASLICAREQYTYNFLVGELGLSPEKVLRTTDIAFEHGHVDTDGGRRALAEVGIGADEAFIGATVVDWAFPGAPSPARSRREYLEKIVALLCRIHQKTGQRVVLFNQVSSDIHLGREVANRCGVAVVQDLDDRSTAVMRGMIERADVFLGSRFHSCVFALLGRVPTVSLAYTYKSNGIMEDLRLPDRVWDIGGFDVDEVASVVENLTKARLEEGARISAALGAMVFPKFAEVLKAFMSDRVQRQSDIDTA
jgi:colanic acid/amylovoran biosynthesis protein